MLYYLGKNNRKNICSCSVQMNFFSNIFNLQLVEPMYAEPADTEGWLHIQLLFTNSK
jgi:hypothetical protein